MRSASEIRPAIDLGEVGLPLRYLDATLAAYEPRTETQRQALEAAQALASETLAGLGLLGPPGIGKSHLLAAACAAIFDARAVRYIDLLARYDALRSDHAAMLEAWRSLPPDDRGAPPDDRGAPPDEPRHPVKPTLPIWCNVPSLIVDMRAELDAPEKEHAARARRLRTHPALVVLDDLGRERMSDWTGELVYAIVNARYEDMLPTAVASNLSPEELRDSGYWPAISRLAEGGRLIVVEGSDYRLGAAPEPVATGRAER